MSSDNGATAGRHRLSLEGGRALRPELGNTRKITNDYLGRAAKRVPMVGLLSVLTAIAQAVALVFIASSALALAQDSHHVHISAGPLSGKISLAVATGLAMACAVLMIGLQISAGRITAYLAKVAEAESRRRIIQAYLATSWEYLSRRERGEFQQILTNNVSRVARAVTYRAVWIFGIVNLVILIGGAFFMAPVLAMIMIVVGTVFALALRPIKARTRKAAAEHGSAEKEFATFVAGMVEQGRETRVFGIGDRLRERSELLNGTASERQRRVQFLLWTAPAIYSGVALLALTIAMATISALGSGHLTSVGPMVILLLRSLIYGQTAFTAMQYLVEAGPYLGELEVHVAMYREAVHVSGSADSGSLRLLALDQVGYRYPGSQGAALTNISLVIERGEAIGVIGPTGSGKSTLAEVLLGLRPVTSGSFTINGVPADSLADASWTRRIAYVPQHSVIIDGTIRDNIRFYRPWITDEDVAWAAREARIHAEILSMPDAYETVVSGLSVGLSGGQRQRLCIARALAGRPELLVMDEPTSGLDVNSERRFIDTIKRLKGDTTLVVIAHRLETIAMCDRVIAIADGRIVRQGPPELVLPEAGLAEHAAQARPVQA